MQSQEELITDLEAKNISLVKDATEKITQLQRNQEQLLKDREGLAQRLTMEIVKVQYLSKLAQYNRNKTEEVSNHEWRISCASAAGLLETAFQVENPSVAYLLDVIKLAGTVLAAGIPEATQP